jgi:hypothetical protein
MFAGGIVLILVAIVAVLGVVALLLLGTMIWAWLGNQNAQGNQPQEDVDALVESADAEKSLAAGDHGTDDPALAPADNAAESASGGAADE